MRIPRKQIKLTVSQMLTIGVFVIAIIFIVSMARKSVNAQNLQIERGELAGEVAHIEAEVNRLQGQLDESRSGVAIEESLREDFGLVGQNEGTVLLDFDEAPAAPQPAIPVEPTPAESLPPHWVEWVRVLINP